MYVTLTHEKITTTARIGIHNRMSQVRVLATTFIPAVRALENMVDSETSICFAAYRLMELAYVKKEKNACITRAMAQNVRRDAARDTASISIPI